MQTVCYLKSVQHYHQVKLFKYFMYSNASLDSGLKKCLVYLTPDGLSYLLCLHIKQ